MAEEEGRDSKVSEAFRTPERSVKVPEDMQRWEESQVSVLSPWWPWFDLAVAHVGVPRLDGVHTHPERGSGG